MTAAVIRRAMGRCALAGLGLCLTLSMAEAIAAFYGRRLYGTWSLESIRSHAGGNRFIQATEESGDAYASSLLPHPYLGFVHRSRPGNGVNNVGLFGPDIPLSRDPTRFTVLLTGGSVACQLGQTNPTGVRYLEEFLNERHVWDGRTVRVLNGGGGAWKQPQQAILFLLFHDVLDAVVTLDGFNEHYMLLDARTRLEVPASNFENLTPISNTGFDALAAAWISSAVRRRVQESPVLGRSYLAWLFAHRLSATLEHAATVWSVDELRARRNIFTLPPGSADAAYAFDIGQYRKYMRAIHSLAMANGIRTAFFIQPAPAIGKPLSAEELRVVGDLSYSNVYARMTEDLLALRADGVPVHSLLNVFEGVAETLYADPIHCIQQGPRAESDGYRRMAEVMAEALVRDWALPRRP